MRVRTAIFIYGNSWKLQKHKYLGKLILLVPVDLEFLKFTVLLFFV